MKTRIRKLAGGGQELIRLLSLDVLDHWSVDDPLSFEKSIVWLEDIEPLAFVRSKIVRSTHSRRGPLHIEGARVVGYSKLTPDAPRDPQTRGYVRRVFYLRPGDEQLFDQGPERWPHSAVDPKLIVPGESNTTVDARQQ